MRDPGPRPSAWPSLCPPLRSLILSSLLLALVCHVSMAALQGRRGTWGSANRRNVNNNAGGTQRGRLDAAQTSLSGAAGPPVLFVIVSQQRTGSTTLMNTLDALPGVRCYGEVFNHHNTSADSRGSARSDVPQWPHTRGFWELPERRRRPREYLDLAIEEARSEAKGDAIPLQAVGFKVHSHHFGWGPVQRRQNRQVFFEQILGDRKVKVVMLTRFDMLAVGYSLQVAQKTRNWHPAPTNEIKTDVELNVTLFKDITKTHVEWYDDVTDTVARAGNWPHLIDYESLNRGRKMAYSVVAGTLYYLGVKGVPLADIARITQEGFCQKRSKERTQSLASMLQKDQYVSSAAWLEDFNSEQRVSSCAEGQPVIG